MDTNLKRCKWAENDPEMMDYHDNFWGKPLYDDKKLFRMLVLETMQAGLSWKTILSKMDNFDQAFDGFDPDIIVTYDDKKEDLLMENKGVIRNKLKIRSVKKNALAYKRVVEDFGSFSAYLWGFVDNKPIVNKWSKPSQVPTKTELSEKLSKDMKKRGFSFVGPTTIYSFMQAVGMVNDHLLTCDFRDIKD